MKTRYLVLAVLTFCTVLFASICQPWETAKPAPLALPEAYNLATHALDSTTNGFHCVSASIYSDAVVSPYGGWLFTFYSTNKPPITKYVTVEFNGKIHVEETLLRTE
jgi:hypothetical protein